MRKLILLLVVPALWAAPKVQSQERNIQADYLDSLYEAWAQDRLMIPVKLCFDLPDSSLTSPGQLTDSVYASRLQSICTVMELTYNQQVKRYIKTYVEDRKQQVALMLALADYYFPMLEEILIQEGLPTELKYMPVIESGLNPVATSRVGAQGLWQFMYRTARSYGLTMNSFIDERWDPLKSSYAAVSYLKDLYAIYGDWYLVIAAYNCGPGNVNKAIRRAGGKTNYWDIYYFLPSETRGYVPAFIAAVYAMNFHHLHQIEPAMADLPVLTDTIWIERDLHLKQVSEVMQIPLNSLKKLNPQYRRNIIPGVGGPYVLQLPFDRVTEFIDLKDSIHAYQQEYYFSSLNASRSPSAGSYIPDPPKGDNISLEYTVKSGDVLGFIAEWYDVGLSRLRYWNNLYGNTIRVGQKLTVYVPADKADWYRRINEMSFSQKQAMNQAGNN